MASVIEICNQALSHIRGGSINSLTEASLEAQVCRQWYETCRDQVLRDAPWGFAHMIKPLALRSEPTDKIFNWAYTYQYPTDVLKINRILLNLEEIQNDTSTLASRYYRFDEFRRLNINIEKQTEYEIYIIGGDKVIGSNNQELRIDYVGRVEDPNLFPPDFIVALGYLLASRISVPIVGVEAGRALRDDSLQLYLANIQSAAANDANEQFTTVPDSDFISIRA